MENSASCCNGPGKFSPLVSLPGDALDTCRAQIASWCQASKTADKKEGLWRRGPRSKHLTLTMQRLVQAEPGVPDMRGSEIVELQLCTVSAISHQPPLPESPNSTR